MNILYVLINFISEFHNIHLSIDDLTTQEKSSQIKGILFETKSKIGSVLRDEVKQIKNEIEVLSIINGENEISKEFQNRIKVINEVCSKFETYKSQTGHDKLTSKEVEFLKTELRPLIYKYLVQDVRVS